MTTTRSGTESPTFAEWLEKHRRGGANRDWTAELADVLEAVSLTGKPGRLRPDGAYLVGQLGPEEMREHALAELECAEAAEHDAMVFSVLTRELDITAREAAVVVAAMRRYRADPANRRDTPHLGDPGAPG